jgi:cytochrome c peroxidase
MNRLLLLFALPALFGLAAQEVGPIPVDDLPRPLVRVPLLGAEELVDGWTASDEEVRLGRQLFFDPILSEDNTVACANCHQPAFAFADNKQFSVGIGGQLTKRNSPALVNRALSTRVFWDGRAASLEEQVLMPIQDPTEMGTDLDLILKRLGGDEGYSTEFDDVYGAPVNADSLAAALSAFVRAIAYGNSPVDQFRNGETAALSTEERAGMWVFEGRGGCWKCHTGPAFSDEQFHNTGVGALDAAPEAGLSGFTKAPEDLGKFRTPGLRMLSQSAPYMHDGSLATLEEVVAFYRDGGMPNTHLSERMQSIKITDDDASALVAFLRALSR